MGGFGGEGGSGGDEGPICPDSLELTFGDTPYAYREDGRNFLTFGERVHLRVATERPLPPNAQVAFNAQGSSIGLTPDDKNLGVIFTPDRIETIWIQAKLTCDGKEVQKEFRYFVIYDREKAVFFDPREGDHTAAGTIGEPLRNPQGYLMGLLKENKRRHLYIREGPVDLLGFGFNTQPEFDVGQDPIIVIGGFGRDFDWTRDITSNQTEFVASIEDVLIESGGNPAPAALVFDGISIFLENGRLRCGNGKLWIINSFVDGRIDASPLCDGIAINSTLVSDRLPSIDTAHSLIVGPRPVLPNRFPHPRIWGNVWVIDKPSQEPIAASHLAQSLGGQRGVAASVGSLQTIVELEANTFQYQGDPPSDGAEHLLALNEAFLPLEPNKQAASPCLTPSDHDSWRVPVLDPAADCSLHAPFLTSEEAILRSALRYDLRGIRRGSSVRWRGPLEPEGPSELDGARLEVHLSGDRPSVGEVVRVELDAEGAEIAEWEVEQQLGVDTSVTHGDSAGQFLIHPTTPGGSTWKVRGRIAGTEAWAEAYARLETMPGNRHVFVDPFAESNGDGGPTAPFRDWPDLGSASVENPIDLIVADGLIDPGQSWLPPHVRVFGGYYRSDDLWVRRPIRSRTQVSSPETILIEAGEPTMPAGIRALDQVDIVPGGASPMVRLEGGPLVLSRSRIWSRSPLPPAIHATISLSIGQASANVALVGNTIALQTESAPGFADATPFIQIDAGASPTLLFNDFRTFVPLWAEEGEVASALQLTGPAKGTYLGNRFFWEPALWDGQPVIPDAFSAFFARPSGSGDFLPDVVSGNALPSRAMAVPYHDGATTFDWDAVEDLATEQDPQAAPNLLTEDCASGSSWDRELGPPVAACLGAAGDAGARAEALDGQLSPSSRLGLRHDRHGRLRPLEGADIGSLQTRQE